MSARPLAFDLGAHNGDDTHYLLLKGYDVVAVEANPARASDIERRFPKEIAAGRLTVINAGIAFGKDRLPFFVHTTNDVLSRFNLDGHPESDFERIEIDTVSALSLIEKFGMPAYLKSDVEGMDKHVVNQLISAKKRPNLISVEGGSPYALAQLIVLGYQRFYIQNCATIERRYKNWPVRRMDGSTVAYSFPHHSTGPCGNDLETSFYDIDAAMLLMVTKEKVMGKGWFDIHAWAG